MKENKKPPVRQITREECLDMTIFEQETPTEKGTGPGKPNETWINMKKNLNSICKEIRKVLYGLEEIHTSLPK